MWETFKNPGQHRNDPLSWMYAQTNQRTSNDWQHSLTHLLPIQTPEQVWRFFCDVNKNFQGFLFHFFETRLQLISFVCDTFSWVSRVGKQKPVFVSMRPLNWNSPLETNCFERHTFWFRSYYFIYNLAYRMSARPLAKSFVLEWKNVFVRASVCALLIHPKQGMCLCVVCEWVFLRWH